MSSTRVQTWALRICITIPLISVHDCVCRQIRSLLVLPLSPELKKNGCLTPPWVNNYKMYTQKILMLFSIKSFDASSYKNQFVTFEKFAYLFTRNAARARGRRPCDSKFRMTKPDSKNKLSPMIPTINWVWYRNVG